ncbi:inosine-uridine preferring nucleoside hydrolase [Gluconacetobacter johannae DSM 13595]|uniref:Nucleoside hydrolase n=1 Tax=Gluconacetobacter johannae TaxID=112140 RepID=A0A7W4P4B1_9PROT|nr:nucleoside hydrolase [Gluconacetobacter johannae]MBB2176907.1 nucleoside hydrolase [Gluconacetobacter johannae]GBQ89508.1 inosine-uridine preferring nucleoside hydrolase [Gluconacetobacter johannae DSM 13595]
MIRPVIIDTDPSPDDAVAFLMALASPDELEVLALTTVGGNVPLHLTTRNALMALELAGRGDVPVYAGAAGPLAGALRTAEHVHGTTGFDGYDLPEPALRAAEGFAPDRIVELVMARPAGSVTLCCLAPLTNVALAMIREPRLAEHLHGIVLMGGARSEAGNITPAAEYNIHVDPEAAARVFASGVPITMIPLDCTHRALTTAARMARLRAIGTPIAEAFYHLLRFNKTFNERQWGTDGGPLHDPTVIAALLQPHLFSGRLAHVGIECHGALTRGMTVIDWWGVTERQPNALVLNRVDAEGYFNLVIDRLSRLCPA